jgi:hypothetical protein
VQGTDVAGLERALAAMEYGEEVPLPSAQPDPIANLSEEELAALLEQSGLAGQLMASGGPVGTPEDVYYFSVPQVMGMMQDPNPQVQGVGMQLADIMSSTPGMDMVPATRDQITMMAGGGSTDPGRDDLMQQLSELDKLVEDEVISQARADYDRQLIMDQLAGEYLGETDRILSDGDYKQFSDMVSRVVGKKGREEDCRRWPDIRGTS